MPKVKLGTRPVMSRFARASVAESAPAKIDTAGGMYKAGLIRNVSVITAGEALGHELWIDAVFVQQVFDALSVAGEQGVKSRFTHPSMCSDGLGKHLGRVNNPVTDKLSVRCDLHFTGSSHESPEGDLANYVMLLVKEDPSAAGLSIAFQRDYQAESQFLIENGASIQEDDDGYPYVDMSAFKSPDPNNVNNYPHARLADLCAVDVVDEPAANPDGMFDSFPIARDVDAALSYALGLSDAKPATEDLFGVNIDRASEFLSRFLSTKGLALVEINSIQEQEPKVAETEVLSTEKVQEEYAADKGMDAEAAETKVVEAAPVVSREAFAAELEKFTTKFGAVNGVEWFSKNKSYEEALELHTAQLTQKLDEATKQAEQLNARLNALKLGEENALSIAGMKPREEKTLAHLFNPAK